MATVQDYLNLITSQYSQQPNFTSMVSFGLTPAAQVQSLMTSMIPIFDLGTPPVGDQLDIIGRWVGVSRNVVIPILGILFSWDDVASDGWDYGIWSSDNNPTSITVLPDDAFLTVINAKIAANRWDGTTEGAYKIYELLFPTLVILFQDEEDMTFYVGVIGIIDSLTLALLVGGYFPLRPEGVLIGGYYTQVDTNPFFGWDVSTTYLDGWDIGSWPLLTIPS